MILGFLGAVLTTFILTSFVFGGIYIMPVYALIGAWLFNFIWYFFKKK
jgi:uncharacterized membrane protein YeaQ/YmgE (transglycosylase-associated protein family)